VDNARRLAEAAGPSAQLWVVDDARHCGAYFADRDAYVQRVGHFFDAALSRGSAREDSGVSV
jgi:hypothetical protein